MVLAKAFSTLLRPEEAEKNSRGMTFLNAVCSVFLASAFPATLVSLLVLVVVIDPLLVRMLGRTVNVSLLLPPIVWVSCVALSLVCWSVFSLFYWVVGKLFDGKGSLSRFAVAYSLPYSALVLLSTLVLVPALGILVLVGLFLWNLVVVFELYKGVMKLSTEKALLAIVVQFLLPVLVMILLAVFAAIFAWLA